ncbi:hypothetical protein PVAND_011910 [Polypedilum vanderplanki]|uniref:Fatty acyl-CoA reductase n=1 Tax=Polypedilum vanderplanki TaxID=319348 RepID=A0A9J6CKT7_POLVA|nr:hypothetical protein PVAND_011910 [Polypedilum vanderplanki]
MHDSKQLNSVQRFYKDKTIFITGASGLMGKVLLEKLLYSCSELKKIIILMRPKREKSELERVAAFAKIPIFQRILKEKPSVMNKIVPVFGDITQNLLGLSDEHLEKVLESQLVFHVAASLRLEFTLKSNIIMNLAGTKNVIDIAKMMPNLQLMVHFSTGFCCPELKVLDEKIIECDDDPMDLIRCSKWMNEAAMAKLQKYVLKYQPNTYTYSKRLAEILCRNEYEKGLNICIVRPSIIIPSLYEPVVGWVDSLNGPAGLMMGAAKGVIRSMLVDSDSETEAIPLDIAVNGIILIAKIVALQERSKEIEVYNITASEKKKRKLGYVLEAAKKINFEIPAEIGLWYPDGQITTSKIAHTINVILFHWLPAYFIDFLMLCLGQKRFQGLEVLQFFTLRNWNFKSDKFKAINKQLSPEEYKMFFIDTESVPDSFENEFIRNCFLGGRLYVLKEPLETIPKARIQIRM